MKLFARNSVLELSHPHVMGILNITPDSFSDGGNYSTLPAALKHAESMINAGASIIDIGGESTRPGAIEVSLDEELTRVLPVIEAISQRFQVWMSVDTSKPEVMREAAKMGVHIINDIRSLTKPGALVTAAEIGLPVCLTHIYEHSNAIQNKQKCNDIFVNINRFFSEKIACCERAGIAKEKLLLDPGFGFGKTFFHNYALLARLSEFHHFNLPLLVGISRKSMINQLLNVGPRECLSGSLACAVIAAMQGAHIIRVHDVKETVDAMRIVEATLLAREQKKYE